MAYLVAETQIHPVVEHVVVVVIHDLIEGTGNVMAVGTATWNLEWSISE